MSQVNVSITVCWFLKEKNRYWYISRTVEIDIYSNFSFTCNLFHHIEIDTNKNPFLMGSDVDLCFKNEKIWHLLSFKRFLNHITQFFNIIIQVLLCCDICIAKSLLKFLGQTLNVNHDFLAQWYHREHRDVYRVWFALQFPIQKFHTELSVHYFQLQFKWVNILQVELCKTMRYYGKSISINLKNKQHDFNVKNTSTIPEMKVKEPQ